MLKYPKDKIRCVLGEIKAKADRTIRVSLDFVEVEDIDRILELLKMRKSFGEEVTIWDALGVFLLIRQENRRRN